MKALLLLLLVAVAGPLRMAKEIPHRVYIPTKNSAVVYLESTMGRCTGTVIAEDLVLTAAHCVTDGTDVSAMFDDGTITVLKVIYVGTPASAEDVALLQGNTYNAAPVKLAKETPIPTACFMYGFAGTHTEMLMPCFLGEDLGPFGVAGIAETRKGDSGGPVFGHNGELIGVIWGAMPDNPYDLIIAPVASVHAALKAIGR